MARLWAVLWTIAGDDDRLSRDFLHMPAGTPVSDAMAWFRTANAELDALEECVVEIRTPGFLRPRRWTYRAREVVIRDRGVLVDGVGMRELAGRLIVGLEWISGRGTVRIEDGAMVRGDVNGVHVSV